MSLVLPFVTMAAGLADSLLAAIYLKWLHPWKILLEKVSSWKTIHKEVNAWI